MADWYTLEEARDEWSDAPIVDEQLQHLLDVAQSAVLTFAHDRYTGQPDADPPVAPVAPTTGMRQAQLLQARNVWNSSAAGASGDLDGGGYGISTFPLDWQVRQLIRPKHGKPVIA